MFKSLIQPLQRFIKGASGKDRLAKKQLAQQLLALQVAYDGLQAECNQLQCDRDQQQSNYEMLQRDRDELSVLLSCADQENKDFRADNEALRSQLQQLEENNQILKGKIACLQQEIELSAYQKASSQSANGKTSVDNSKTGPTTSTHKSLTDKASILPSPSLENINLSEVSLALVGGHETTHREVAEALKKYGLKRCIHVPPHSIASYSRHQIKDKISHCDLIITITSYVDHSVVRCVKQLKDARMLAGEVIRVSCHGKSGVIREVLRYFSSQPA